jgi:hypothetical protein
METTTPPNDPLPVWTEGVPEPRERMWTAPDSYPDNEPEAD